MLSDEQRTALMADLPADAVRSREGAGGRSLSYVDGAYVYARLCEVLGPGSWGYDLRELRDAVPLREVDGRSGKRWSVSYIAIVTLTCDGAQPITDTGYGSGIDRDPGAAVESATKEAVTDAVKRCARALGWSAGLALYDKTQAHVGGRGGQQRPGPHQASPPSGSSGGNGGGSDDTISGGKYKGTPWAEVPHDYLEWASREMKNERVKARAAQELAAREAKYSNTGAA